LPRNSLVVFTGISGSGKSSLAFGTLFAESQHRYLDSVSPYARRLIDQVDEPDVDSIEGLPPAVALQQQRGAPSVRSSVGSVTTISNALRMLYSRAGEYPKGQGILYADAFSPNTPQGACPECHGIGRVFNVTEELLVPDPTKSIKERAIAAWPPAWQGKSQALKGRVPPIDKALSAFINDIYAKGMNKDVLLVVTGEFGRTYKINGNAGRDHWPRLSPLMLAGGDFPTGRFIGESTSKAEEPKTNPVNPQNVTATLLKHFGIDQHTQRVDMGGRPRYFLEAGTPSIL